jgi:hypothetical protein
VGPTPAVPVAEAVTQNNCASEETEYESFNCAFEERERERERERAPKLQTLIVHFKRQSTRASNHNRAFQETQHESFKP